MSPTLTISESRLCALRKNAISFFDETLVWIWPAIAVFVASCSLITWKNVGMCASLSFVPQISAGLLFSLIPLGINILLVGKLRRRRREDAPRCVDCSLTLNDVILIVLTVGVPGLFAAIALHTSVAPRTMFTAYTDGKHIVADYQASIGEDRPFISKIRDIQNVRYHVDDEGKLTPLTPVAEMTTNFVAGDVKGRRDACLAFAQRVEKESVDARASVAPADVEKAGKN